MAKAELLKDDKVVSFLRQAAQRALCGSLTALCGDKWTISDVVIYKFSDSGVHFTLSDRPRLPAPFKPEQPVGLCLQQDYYKYIFESKIAIASDTENTAEIVVEVPDKIEKMPRRAFERQSIPAGLNVRAMFWHRGHLNDLDQTPQEDYWQGKLENLSAGGTMIRVGGEQREFFSIGQLVGVQFTPMSYQKPLLLEGHVRHLDAQPDSQNLLVGVEFLGLEASPEGRDILHRLLDIVDKYEKLNKKYTLV